jgi:hypothetical protein
MFVRDLVEAPPLSEGLSDPAVAVEMAEAIRAGDALVVRRAFPVETIERMIAYLRKVAQSSLPNYQAIVEAAPNFHRVYGDPRSYVEGRFHQFSFFPWNQDVFRLFDRVAPIYRLNNAINGWPADRYLGLKPEAGCIARVTFQAYPRGVGYIRPHEDAAGPHKFTTVSMCLTKKGVDYREGGLVLSRGEGESPMDVDAQLDVGDVVYMHSQLVHGVDLIDPGAEEDWLALQGKWTMILAVNKLEGTTEVPDSVQIQG